MKKFFAILALALLLVSCGPKTLNIAFDQVPSAQYAGVYCALQNGYYKDAGLDVKISYVGVAKGYQALQSDEADIIDEPLFNAIEFKSRTGMDMVNFLQTSQMSGLRVVTHEEVSEFKQLEGRLIGYTDNGYDLMVRAIFAMKGMNVEWLKVKDYHDFLDGKVDAYISMDYGDLFYIAGAGTKPVYVFPLSRMGFDIPEDGFYTMRNKYKSDRRAYEDFAEATIKGWQWADTNRVKAVKIVMDEVAAQGGKPDEKHEDWILTEVLRYQIDPLAKKPTFILFEETEDAANRILVNSGLATKSASVLYERKTPLDSTLKAVPQSTVDSFFDSKQYKLGVCVPL